MKKQIVILISLAFLALTSLNLSCSHSTEGLSDIKEVCFESQVLPIFQTNCAISGCHEGDKSKAGLTLSDYNSIMKSITPNKPKDSRAYEAVISTWGNLMPPSPKKPLTLEQRTLIALWIEQGAKDTKCN
jgi:hypothetical protein